MNQFVNGFLKGPLADFRPIREPKGCQRDATGYILDCFGAMHGKVKKVLASERDHYFEGLRGC